MSAICANEFKKLCRPDTRPCFHVSSVHKTLQPWWMACRVWLGDLRVVVFVVFCGFCVLFAICLLKMDISCPCTNVFPTAYAHVRTEPLPRHRPNSGEKNDEWHVASHPKMNDLAEAMKVLDGKKNNITPHGVRLETWPNGGEDAPACALCWQ